MRFHYVGYAFFVLTGFSAPHKIVPFNGSTKAGRVTLRAFRCFEVAFFFSSHYSIRRYCCFCRTAIKYIAMHL